MCICQARHAPAVPRVDPASVVRPLVSAELTSHAPPLTLTCAGVSRARRPAAAGGEHRAGAGVGVAARACVAAVLTLTLTPTLTLTLTLTPTLTLTSTLTLTLTLTLVLTSTPTLTRRLAARHGLFPRAHPARMPQRARTPD